MRKIILMSSAIILIQNFATVSANDMSGLGVGVKGGYISGNSKLKIARPNDSSQKDRSDIAGRGVMGGVYLNWNRIHPSGNFLGIELGGYLSNLKGQKSVNGTMLNAEEMTNKIKLKHAYDFNVKIGHLFKHAAMPFFKAGLALGRWKSITSSVTIANSSVSKYRLGWLVGAGVDFPLNHRMSVGGEWNFTQYKKLSTDAKNNAGQTARVVQVTPSTNAFMLRLNYKLGK